ncbi:MAG: urease accessory protein UreH domain-containing protein [Saccharofermentanales bacterium]
MLVSKVFRISGMTCPSCEKRVSDALKRVKGVSKSVVSLSKKEASVFYDSSKTNEQALIAAITAQGYTVRKDIAAGSRHPAGKVIPILLIVLALYFIIRYTAGFDFINLIPKIDTSISLIALFITGLLTSVHCIAMCGGINLSQSVGTSESSEGKFRKPLLYNSGRVVSYAIIGGIAGGIGSALFISSAVKGIIMLAAAVFMILMSLSMLGWIPWRFTPRIPAGAAAGAAKARQGKGPFLVGLLNGLMPCGPLQAMQIYALSTGSILFGALSMFLFSLGTVPLMLGAGLIFSLLKGKYSSVITRVSAVLIMLIAVVMLSNAGSLIGIRLHGFMPGGNISGGTASSAGDSGKNADGYIVAQMQDGFQVVEGDLLASGYPDIIVQAGIPVKFNIKADRSDINGCNGTAVFAEFNIEQEFEAGDNIIEFTPNETGDVTYTCWMGMVDGRIRVVDDLGSYGNP